MKASGSSVYKTRQAVEILKAWSRRIPYGPCQHPQRGIARNVRIFVNKEGQLASPKDDDVTTLAEAVVSCASKTCEKVFSVTRHGHTYHSSGGPERGAANRSSEPRKSAQR